MVINGVTNINVPGDTDGAANGQITAQLDFPSFDFVQSAIGQYLFRLSSPVGHFTSIVKSFSVTNFPYAQSFAGNVVSNGTSTTLPNAVVLLFPPPDGQDLGHPVALAVADNSGHYTIPAPAAGTYLLFAAKSNFVASLATPTVVALAAGATVITNLSLLPATQSISGQYVDANNSSIKLPGVFIGARSEINSLIALGFTDTNGNFTIGVRPDVWDNNNSGGLIVLGHVGFDNNVFTADTTTGSVAGLTVAFPQATALFYGTVEDSLGNPLPGITIETFDGNNNVYRQDGDSDANGNYVVGAVGGLGSNDPWQVYVYIAPADFIFSQFAQGTQVALGTGQAYQYNFTALPGATNTISGNVQFNGTNVVGVGVNANATINGVQYQPGTAHTDSNGNYSINVANGDWSVSVNCYGGSDSLDSILGSGIYQCPNSQNVTINNNNGTANFTIFPPNSGQIFGYVADDYGNPVDGVSVYASDGLGDNYSTTTGGNGYYSMVVVNSAYNVTMDCGQLDSMDYQCPGTNSVSVSNDSVEADFALQLITTPTYPFTPLYDFSATTTNAIDFLTNSDGAYPYCGLVLSGNILYGTAYGGGTNGDGTVFAVNTNLTGFAAVHTFAAAAANSFGIFTNGDGAGPGGDLVLSGTALYGMAEFGGTNGNGTVYAVNTNGSGFRLLHTFSGLDQTYYTNSDGANPYAGLILAGNALYGTAEYGGTNGNGTVFAVNTNGGGFRIVHTFTALDAGTDTTNSDGAYPVDGLAVSGSMLYGTALNGGTNGYGTVFAVNTNGTGFTTLYSFTGSDDGAYPYAGLTVSSNTLYGVATYGGMWGNGTAFALNTNGAAFTVLHGFTGGDDGSGPAAGLVVSSNVVFGTASYGGSENAGTVFEINIGDTNFAVLHAFADGNDGANPEGDLILSNNILYGTASDGGANGNGTVFALSITPLPPEPAFSSPMHLSNGKFSILLNGVEGQNYTLQMSTNLISGNWTTLFVTNNATTNSFMVTDPNATNSARFYRVLVGP